MTPSLLELGAVLCWLVFGWLVLCGHAAQKIMATVHDDRSSATIRAYASSVTFLQWVNGTTVGGSSVARWLVMPFLWLLLAKREPAEKAESGAAQRTIAEASATRRRLYEAGRVWLHPVERDRYQQVYGDWVNGELRPTLQEKASRAFRYNLGSALRDLQSDYQPCQCIEPLFQKHDGPMDRCLKGHILPRDAWNRL